MPKKVHKLEGTAFMVSDETMQFWADLADSSDAVRKMEDGRILRKYELFFEPGHVMFCKGTGLWPSMLVFGGDENIAHLRDELYIYLMENCQS